MVVARVDPERKRTLNQFGLKINGSNAAPSLEQAIIKVVIDERLNSPSMLELHLLVDPHQTKLIDDPMLSEGKEIEFFAGYMSEESSLCVVKITSIEVDLDDQMPTVVVRGYDRSFALHRDVKSRSFLDQTDSDIARKIAAEAGLSVQVDSTPVTNPYVLQYAQTNHEFLLERARRIGYEFRVIGRDLHFRKPEPKGSPITLEWGATLKRFSPRLSVAEQVDVVEVRAWDPENKTEMIANATSGSGAPHTGESKSGAKAGQEVWGKATRTITDAAVATPEEASSVAQAALDELTSSFIQATGECAGDPKLRVGSAITVKGVGTRFGGDYYLTAARHIITKQEGHRIEFTASTRNPGALASLLAAPQDRPRAPHIIVGIVTNNQDPSDLGRVKVRFPTLFDSDESFWARLVAPAAGKDRGFYVVPEVNDEVVVAFENGDPNRPYIMGSLWNGKDLPPKGTAKAVDGSGSVNQRLWRSRSGHLFIFDDTDGQESIQIIDKTEKNHIIITSNDNKLDVQIEGDITVTSKTGKISMTAERDINIESTSGKVSVKGMTTAFEAQQSATMKTGTSLDLQSGTSLAAKAGTGVEVSGGTTAKLSGNLVDVQGQAVTNIKGGIVNIN